jgi:hypothetical protein
MIRCVQVSLLTRACRELSDLLWGVGCIWSPWCMLLALYDRLACCCCSTSAADPTFFDLNCPAGTWIKSFTVKSGDYMDSVTATCSDETVLGPVGGTGGGNTNSATDALGFTTATVYRWPKPLAPLSLFLLLKSSTWCWAGT